ncbi:hypothetical protein M8C21_030673, partial [Ambrosia artemisiifolia]
CAVVTGGNTGVGFEICRQLALNKIYVILTARNESRGIEAVKKLNDSGIDNVVFHQLDVTDPTSAPPLVKFIETKFKKLDILVNNAAVLGGRYIVEKVTFIEGQAQVIDAKGNIPREILEETYEMAEECVQTNYYGARMVAEALLPLLQLSKSPRIVNVSSSYGLLFHFPNEKLKEGLNDIDNLTKERLHEIMQSFLRDFKAGKLVENGWNTETAAAAYGVAKLALNTYTRQLAKQFPNFRVNAVNPGYCKTGLTLYSGREPSEGAKMPVKAALFPDDGPTGVYYQITRQTPF